LPEVQASVYGAERILPALPGTLHLESGILGECRLSDGDGRAARLDDFALGFSFFPVSLSIKDVFTTEIQRA